MAEIAEIFEVIDEAADGIADEAEEAGDMDPEEKAQFEEEVADAKEEVNELAKCAKDFKNLIGGFLKFVKSFVIFAMKNAAVGSILYLVSVGLSKIIKATKGKEQNVNKKILAIVNANILLMKTEYKLCNAIKDWLQKHKDDIITLDGIPLKLEAIFEIYLKPIADAIEKTYSAAKHLLPKKDGKASIIIPTVADINNLLDGSVSFLASLRNLRDFAELQKDKVVSLNSFLETLTLDSLDEIQNQIELIKKCLWNKKKKERL